MHYCNHTLSVVRPSICPSVVVNFSHFRLLWNRWKEINETWQKARCQRPLLSLCFSGRSEKQDGRPGLGLAETFSTSPLKPLNEIQRNLTGSKISTSSTNFIRFFFRADRKTRLAEAFSTSPLNFWNRWMEFCETYGTPNWHKPNQLESSSIDQRAL